MIGKNQNLNKKIITVVIGLGIVLGCVALNNQKNETIGSELKKEVLKNLENQIPHTTVAIEKTECSGFLKTNCSLQNIQIIDEKNFLVLSSENTSIENVQSLLSFDETKINIERFAIDINGLKVKLKDEPSKLLVNKFRLDVNGILNETNFDGRVNGMISLQNDDNIKFNSNGKHFLGESSNQSIIKTLDVNFVNNFYDLLYSVYQSMISLSFNKHAIANTNQTFGLGYFDIFFEKESFVTKMKERFGFVLNEDSIKKEFPDYNTVSVFHYLKGNKNNLNINIINNQDKNIYDIQRTIINDVQRMIYTGDTSLLKNSLKDLFKIKMSN